MEEVFRDQIRIHLRAGVKHLYVFGTAGEGYAVTESLFDSIVQVFADEMRRDPDAQPIRRVREADGRASPRLAAARRVADPAGWQTAPTEWARSPVAVALPPVAVARPPKRPTIGPRTPSDVAGFGGVVVAYGR